MLKITILSIFAGLLNASTCFAQCLTVKEYADLDKYNDLYRIRESKIYRTGKLDSEVEHLDITSPTDCKIPEEVYNFRNLHFLFISSMHLNCNDFVRFKEIECIRLINIRSCKIDSFPKAIMDIPNLSILEISHCSFKYAPKHLFNSRTILELKFTSMIKDTLHLPEEVEPLSQIKEILIERSFLAPIPEGFCEMPNLRTLNLNGSTVKSLPENIGRLKKLSYLDLASTTIERLPDGVGDLQNLRTLNLTKTKIKKFPECLYRLKNIALIYVSGTEIGATEEERVEIFDRFEKLGKTDVQIIW